MEIVRLENVTKKYSQRFGEEKLVLDKINLSVNSGEKIGILGKNGAGKSTLCRLLAKSEPISGGSFFLNGSSSWPVGVFNCLSNNLTGYQNISFISRVYGTNPKILYRHIYNVSELYDELNNRVSTYSSGMKAKLAFFLAFSFDFDLYISDEITSVGDINFRVKASQYFKEVIKDKALILCSHDENLIRKNTDFIYVLHERKISPKLSVSEGIEYYKKCLNS